jgi:exodeoxyribonuclease V gamma subunit
VPRPPLLTGPLPALPPADVELEALQKLLLHPAREFLRQRLELASARAEEDLTDGLPIELDSLQQWALGDRLLQHRLAGMSAPECIAFERRRGLLPPGALGTGVLRQVGRRVDRIVAASAAEWAGVPESHDVELGLADGTRLTGTVRARGDVLLTVTYSRPGPKHRLRAWTDLVALTAARPGPWRAVVVGRDREDPSCVLLDPVDAADARATVEELVALYRAGLRGPLPLPLKTAAAYAERRVRGSRPPAALEAASAEWLERVLTRDSSTIPGEQDDDEHELLYGVRAPLRVLLEAKPEPDETGPGWPVDEPERFGLLSRRVWERLLAHERRERR